MCVKSPTKTGHILGYKISPNLLKWTKNDNLFSSTIKGQLEIKFREVSGNQSNISRINNTLLMDQRKKITGEKKILELRKKDEPKAPKPAPL